MTEQNIPDVTVAERRLAREWAEHVESSRATWGDRFRAAARVILDSTSVPTLADMTREERRECQWMQADVLNRSTRYVIAVPFDDEAETGLISADEGIGWAPSDHVTPRPDLPRLEWPGEQQPAPAPALPEGWRLADHIDHGRVVVTTAPNSDGYVYIVGPTADPEGFDWYFCTPDALTYIDQ